MYHGPELFEKLSCINCKTDIITQKIKVKGAPSENWKEVIELWQCHNESFDQFVDPLTQ